MSTAVTPFFRLCFKMSKYLFLSIIASIKTNSPTSFDEIQPQIMTLPPSCLIVGLKFLKLNSWLRLRRTIFRLSGPNKLNLLSSAKITSFHQGCFSSINYLVNTNLFLRFASFTYGFLRATLPLYSYSFNTRRIVSGWTFFSDSSNNSALNLGAFKSGFFIFLLIFRLSRSLSIFGRLFWRIYSIRPSRLYLFMSATILLFNFKGDTISR